MSVNFEELDYTETPIGDLMLRRRRMSQFGDLDIYEVKLADDFLMTSLFHEAEDQLAICALAEIEKDNIDVVIGGLGLGYTAAAALQDSRVSSLVVVEYLESVIQWHQGSLVPMGSGLTSDTRCKFVHADFFALSADAENSFDPEILGKKHDVILLDIDHTPTNVLHQINTHFYTEQGLIELKSHLKPDGVFALWADGRPEEYFTQRLEKVFSSVKSHTIEFDNPITCSTSTGAVYVAKM